jgi:eukaryotic-like serine/threonine-protein kinase
MAIQSGTRLGPYEITAAIGTGGMGEVYRATDTNLGRQVAIKVLPDTFASDPERLARFEREAKTLAALNHPNIAQIYGFEKADGIRALVMELVEGPTLADRIAQGPIPLDEVLPIAKQIAEALEAAHEQGIIHRDLKPANIKLRRDGAVKVLDFGLAKALEPISGAGIDATASPTITSPAMMTGVGVLLGTAAYMSPEQARGKAVDKRSDIWAFGCVLYEMLTGGRPFDAGEVSDTLALVLLREVDWSSLPTSTPSPIHRLLRRCLEKDRKHRLPDIGVARLEIEDALAAPSSAAESPRTRRPARQRVAWTAAAGFAVAAIALAVLHFSESPPRPAASIRFSVTPPADMLISGQGHWLSPDGRYLAFRVAPRGALAATGPTVRLAIRSFHEADARVLPGTEGVWNAFWSPDSRFLAFFADGKLQKIDITGGPPQVLCDASSGASTGGTWNSDGTIVFSVGDSARSVGLFRVSSGGGTPVQVTTPDASRNEGRHAKPRFLPDGRHFLYVVPSGTSGSLSQSSVHVGSLLDGEPAKHLLRSDTEAIYADGFLLYVLDGTLLAQPFDPDRLELTGDRVVVAQNIDVLSAAALNNVSASTTGLLSYRTTSSEGVGSQLMWFDRSGKMLGTVGERADQTEVQLSPDGTRAAVSVLDPARRTRDIWIYDLMRNGLRTRFTFDAGEDWSSVWSPDGRSLIFTAGRPSPLDLYQKNADGSGAESRLVESEGAGRPNKFVRSWSADGRFVLYNSGAFGSPMGNDLWVLSLSQDRKPRALLDTPFNEVDGRFSPDGRWVAYRSNESGRNEIYVMPFTGEGGKWQVSTTGGDQPRWRRDGRELFYISGSTIVAAEVNGTGPAFQVGTLRRLFDVNRRTTPYLGFGTGTVYDVTADGQRFLVNAAEEQAGLPPPITVITNWTTTLR